MTLLALNRFCQLQSLRIEVEITHSARIDKLKFDLLLAFCILSHACDVQYSEIDVVFNNIYIVGSCVPL